MERRQYAKMTIHMCRTSTLHWRAALLLCGLAMGAGLIALRVPSSVTIIDARRL